MQVINPPNYACGQPFAQCADDDHNEGDLHGLNTFQSADVDNHTYTDEKIRDEQGIADKLDVRHQRARGRNVFVECQAG